MKGQSVTPKFYVVKGHIAPILGSDVMRLFGFVKLDFVDQVVTVGPEVHSPKLEHDFKVRRISGVVISDNMVVPSRHEIVVQWPVDNDTPEELESLINQPCIFECDRPVKDDDRIGVSRVLGTVRDGRFAVRICNPLPHDLELRKTQKAW